MRLPTKLITPTQPGGNFQDDFDQRLSQLLDSEVRNAPTAAMADLWLQITRATQGGKRFRPMLVQLGYRTLCENPEPRVIEIGCAFELLHTALVIHDDIIDQDFLRRGKPTLSAQYRDLALSRGKRQADAEHLGHAAALLAGDVLITKAIALVQKACEGLDFGYRIIELFHCAITQSTAGELDDVLFSADVGTPDLDGVLQMHRLKTTVYSFETPLVIGALLGGASDDLLDQLSQLATLLGSSYQILDDVLGTFGDSAATGKPNDSDLREGKATVLIAIADSMPEAAGVVEQWRAGLVDSDTMRQVLLKFEVADHARNIAARYSSQASQQVENLPIRDAARVSFRHLIRELLQRDR